MYVLNSASFYSCELFVVQLVWKIYAVYSGYYHRNARTRCRHNILKKNAALEELSTGLSHLVCVSRSTLFVTILRTHYTKEDVVGVVKYPMYIAVLTIILYYCSVNHKYRRC